MAGKISIFLFLFISFHLSGFCQNEQLNLNKLIQKVKSLYQQGKYQQAVQDASKVLVYDPQNVEARNYMDKIILGHDLYKVDSLVSGALINQSGETALQPVENNQLPQKSLEPVSDSSFCQQQAAQICEKTSLLEQELNKLKDQIDQLKEDISNKDQRIEELEGQLAVMAIVTHFGNNDSLKNN